jgi:hypothetical protein
VALGPGFRPDRVSDVLLFLQVSTFGSVPLKTYLPDGDIDVVAFAHNQPFRSSWANDVRAALDREEKKQQAEFRVREVQFIQAEVRKRQNQGPAGNDRSACTFDSVSCWDSKDQNLLARSKPQAC